MRISDWSSDVCSSDLTGAGRASGGVAIPCPAAPNWRPPGDWRLGAHSDRLYRGCAAVIGFLGLAPTTARLSTLSFDHDRMSKPPAVVELLELRYLPASARWPYSPVAERKGGKVVKPNNKKGTELA